MRSAVPTLIVLGVLTAVAPASAACRWFGTQIECDFRDTRVVIGTQTAEEPNHAKSARPQPFLGGGEFPDDETPTRPFGLDLQDIGVDPNLCRKIGNETYCY